VPHLVVYKFVYGLSAMSKVIRPPWSIVFNTSFGDLTGIGELEGDRNYVGRTVMVQGWTSVILLVFRLV
jgi:hypothetical protein